MNTTKNEYMVFVLLLKHIAEAKGITHQEIADKTGYNRPNITRIFSLKYSPRLDVFLNIAKAIGVNFFFEDKEGKTDLSVLFEKAMTELGRRGEIMNRN